MSMKENLMELDEIVMKIKEVNATAQYVYDGIVYSPYGFEKDKAEWAMINISDSYRNILERLEVLHKKMMSNKV